MVHTVTLETPRLVLRLPQEEDAGPLMEIHHDPQAVKYVVFGATPASITAAWRNIAIMLGHWQIRGYGQWTVVEKASGDVIGRVGLWHPEGWPGIELGWIIRHSRWNNGFATEAARAALEWTWQRVRTDHVISVIQPDNAPSIRVAEKIGERFERNDSMNGADVLIYSVRREGSLNEERRPKNEELEQRTRNEERNEERRTPTGGQRPATEDRHNASADDPFGT